MIYLELFLGFLKVGCFTFGGGYGAVALIRDVVLSNGWLSEEMLTYMIAVSESTPGPIMVNMATYVGSSQGGLLGAFTATAAVVLPSFSIILLVMILLKTLLEHPTVRAVLNGLKPCITGIILATGTEMIFAGCLPQGSLDRPALGITAILAVILFGSKYGLKKKLSPIALICIAAVLGVIVYGI